ncbi:zinc ribbon domain-containing protein [Pseudofrankia sp. DC12]|uniref:zinc ribbon domain-containing protein n=1 Tax=Pseudofrankia sp. DC12 TaxID=683315 RepID=UPI0005F7A438|nr:zinc ribbon domain-containing protein [Pseudofrankia sp. DC12]
MSAAFDGSGYRQRVLAVLRARSPLRIDDPFLVADLDPEGSHSDADVAARLARVLGFLQRERGSAKYATLATELVRRRAEWEAPLLDPAQRERVRALVVEARRDGDTERLAKVDGYLATVRERFGGIPTSRVDGLRRLAAQAGVTGERFDVRLARERIIEDAAGARVAPLPPDARGQIRDRLDELRALRRGDHASTASLWAFLGVAPESPPARLAAAYEAVAAVNARRPHDREKTVTADLLALVRARLLEADPAAYSAGLLADAAEELRGAVEEHVLLDGEITAVAFEGLMRRALGTGRGLSAAQIRTVVLGLARDLGVPVSTGATVDFVVCPSCARPEPVGEVRVCRYCDTDLYVVCPSCARLTEAAAVVCRHCGQSVRQSRDATEAIGAIRRALDEGQPAQAVELVGRARPLLAALGGPAGAVGEELAARAAAALAAAEAGWRALADDRAAGRAQAALDRARWLVAQAADVRGPDGRDAAEVLAELTVAQAMIRRRVDAALGLPPAQREAALVAVLASASDSPEALAALAALPLGAPADLVAVPTVATGPTGAVLLRWRSADTAAPVTFWVDRVVAGTLGVPPTRAGLGTTTVAELTDAGAPAWAPVFYEVTAFSANRRSAVARTAPLVLTREVEQLRAAQTADGVRLTWRLDGPVQVVTVERAVDAVDPSVELAADEDADPATGGGAAPGAARVVDRSVRHTRAGGGTLTDPDVQAGVTYRYRLSVEYVAADGMPARTAGVEISVPVVARPLPVLDLAVSYSAGGTMLRWTAQPGGDVRVYAAPGVLPDVGAPPGGRFGAPPAAPVGPFGPFGPENVDLPLEALTGPVRLVGASRRGRLLDPAAVGPVVYTPVSVVGGRGVTGRSVQHIAPGGVTELRAEDRGDELVLFFRLAPGLTEARVLWRRDRTPTGPDDPTASAATVTVAGMQPRGGGWRLSAPRDGWPYYVACFPVFRVAGQPRAAAAGAEVVVRAPARPRVDAGAVPPLATSGAAAPAAGPLAAPGPSYLASVPAGPATSAIPVAVSTGALPMPSPGLAQPPVPAAPPSAGPPMTGLPPRVGVPMPAAGPMVVGGPPVPGGLLPAGAAQPQAVTGPVPQSPAGFATSTGPTPLPMAAGAPERQPGRPLPPMVNPPTGAGLPIVGRLGAPAGPGPASFDAPLPDAVGPMPAGPLPTSPGADEEIPSGPGWFRPAMPVPVVAFQPFPAEAPRAPLAEAGAEPAWTPAVPGSADPGAASPAGRFPALGAPAADSPAGWTLPATHTDLFAPVGQGAAAGFGAPTWPPGLATVPAAAGGSPPDGYGAGQPAAGPDGRSDQDGRSDAADSLLEDLDDESDEHADDDQFGDDLDDDRLGSGEPRVSYFATRAGWRRRVLRLRVRTDGVVPELVLVARPGTVPPATLGDGQALARLAPSAERATRTMDVRLEGALLPWGIRLLPAAAAAGDLTVDHPPDEALVIR